MANAFSVHSPFPALQHHQRGHFQHLHLLVSTCPIWGGFQVSFAPCFNSRGSSRPRAQRPAVAGVVQMRLKERRHSFSPALSGSVETIPASLGDSGSFNWDTCHSGVAPRAAGSVTSRFEKSQEEKSVEETVGMGQ